MKFQLQDKLWSMGKDLSTISTPWKRQKSKNWQVRLQTERLCPAEERPSTDENLIRRELQTIPQIRGNMCKSRIWWGVNVAEKNMTWLKKQAEETDIILKTYKWPTGTWGVQNHWSSGKCESKSQWNSHSYRRKNINIYINIY